MKPKTDTAKLTPKEALRNQTITVKCTPTQKVEIQVKAARCGMTPSSYLLARGYNYSPKSRLTDAEKALLQPLRDSRIDVINYTNALNVLNDDERKQLFRRNAFMVGWLQEIGPVYNDLERYLKRISSSNRMPPRTRKTS